MLLPWDAGSAPEADPFAAVAVGDWLDETNTNGIDASVEAPSDACSAHANGSPSADRSAQDSGVNAVSLDGSEEPRVDSP
ncbi:hypothetical protein ACFL5O_03495 [Myxococcota bacterium]